MASDTQTDRESSSQLTLLGLPAELRNSIYFLVAAGNTRPLLVSRLMQLESQRALLPPDNRDNVTLENRLNNAVGLHPLSQTCRQLRDEFQPVFLHHSAPCHRLVVNNFDVAQTEFIANFLRKHRIVDLWQDRVRRYVYASGIVGRIEVEFRGDSDIVKSTEALLHHIRTPCELRKEPNGLATGHRLGQGQRPNPTHGHLQYTFSACHSTSYARHVSQTGRQSRDSSTAGRNRPDLPLHR